MTGPAAQQRTGVYPGSFNPPTIAHLAIAEAALVQHGLDRIDLIMSRVTLAKESVELPHLEDRLRVLDDVASTRPWLGVVVTDHQLLVDIATGYDLLIVGADKWRQIQEPQWYGGPAERDAVLERLPTVAVAPRPPHATPADRAIHLPAELERVSSSAARSGKLQWLLREAHVFDESTGAWSDDRRYRAWVADGRPDTPAPR